MADIDIIYTLAMKALAELRQNNYCFTKDYEAEEELEVYKDEINNVLGFFASCCERADKKNKVYTKDLFDAYRKWCGNNCTKAFTASQFSRSFNAVFGFSSTTVRVNGGIPAKGYKGIILKQIA